MAVKRIFNKNNIKSRKCLKCNHPITKTLRDNVIYTCKCGQSHFVDIYGNRCALTVKEKPQLRNRHLDLDNPSELTKITRESKEWKKIAEDLAVAIEKLKEESKP